MIASEHTKDLEVAWGSFVAGGGLMRAWNYLAHALPPKPDNAGFFTSLLYNIVSGTSGHDPTNNPTKP